MQPESPVIPGYEDLIPEIVFAKDQPQYHALPSIRIEGDEGEVITRWKPSAEELALLNAGEAVYLSLFTFNGPLQPIRMEVVTPDTIASRLIPTEEELTSLEAQ